MTIELTLEETNFLQSILTNVMPNVQVPAKDAPQILQMCESVLLKLKGGDNGDNFNHGSEQQGG